MDDLQYSLGGKQEVNEAAESVSSVLPFHHTEELPQDGGSGDTEGSVQGRQGALDTVVQRLSVLRKQQGWIRLDIFHQIKPNMSPVEGDSKPHQSYHIQQNIYCMNMSRSVFFGM